MTSLYQKLLDMSNLVFLGWIFLVYLALNALFALLYYVNGIEYLSGAVANGGLEDFMKCYYFSVQTFYHRGIWSHSSKKVDLQMRLPLLKH